MNRNSAPSSSITTSACTVACEPSGKDTLSVMGPVQSGFTAYVPSTVTVAMLPFALNVAVPSVLPFPSNVCLPTSAKGPAKGGGTYSGSQNSRAARVEVRAKVSL
jgi:hypothetical protein